MTGHTADGFVNFISSNVEQMNIIQIKHPSHALKTTIFEQLIGYFKSDHDLEIICSSISQMFIEGLIIRDLSLAILSHPVITEDLHVSHHIHLTNVFGKIADFSAEHETIGNLIQTAYDNFAQGLKIHDDLERIYINEMDFSCADVLADRFIEKLLCDVKKQDRQQHIYRRLFGTNTIEGSVNIVPHLIQTVNKRYYVKGRAGTGKSVFMNKVADACINKGFDIELYHCSFDPSSIDMVIVRDLDFCMFDSTDPHEFTPEHEHDVVIDLYEETVTPGTDERFSEDIKRVTQAYKAWMKKGVTSMKEAGIILNDIEKKYMGEIVDKHIETSVKDILKRLA